MTNIKLRTFPDKDSFRGQLGDLLIKHMNSASPVPHAVMLSGGSTPVPVYTALSSQSVSITENLFVLYTDERMVPSDSPDSNFGNTSAMLNGLGIPKDNVLRIRSELGIEAARMKIEKDIFRFIKSGGKIALGILGLGTDGHTCSLFTLEDAEISDCYTLAVRNRGGFDRISVTAKVLRSVDQLIFMVSGETQIPVMKKLLSDPDDLPAGRAVRNHPNVELWTEIDDDRLR
jgi:6-phosphogluconolactonase